MIDDNTWKIKPFNFDTPYQSSILHAKNSYINKKLSAKIVTIDDNPGKISHGHDKQNTLNTGIIEHTDSNTSKVTFEKISTHNESDNADYFLYKAGLQIL